MSDLNELKAMRSQAKVGACGALAVLGSIYGLAWRYHWDGEGGQVVVGAFTVLCVLGFFALAALARYQSRMIDAASYCPKCGEKLK